MITRPGARRQRVRLTRGGQSSNKGEGSYLAIRTWTVAANAPD